MAPPLKTPRGASSPSPSSSSTSSWKRYPLVAAVASRYSAFAATLPYRRKLAVRYARSHPRLALLSAVFSLFLLSLLFRSPRPSVSIRTGAAGKSSSSSSSSSSKRFGPLVGLFRGLQGSASGPSEVSRGSTFARSAEFLKDEKAFVLRERAEIRAYLASLEPYSPKLAGVTPGTRGVVLTGPGKSIPKILMAVMLLRETGCNLPVQYSYLKDEVNERELEIVRKFNITARDFTSAIADNDWGPEEFRLGGPKVDSILASPFEQVLFLDPDNYVLRDPTYLFDTKVFKKYGAIFWPDFPVRKNDSELIVWDVMGLKGKYWKELEFESGQVVLDKSRTWRALMLAKYISQQAKYYFTQFLGDKEAFFWGFAGTNTPYFLTPTYIHSVGAIVDDEHPGGSNDVYLNDPNTKYCGQSMMQSDFYDDPDNPVPDSFVPEPLFMHWNMLKYKYVEGVDYFQSAMTYEVPKGTKFADYKSVGFRVHGDWGYFSHCLDLRHVKGLNIRVWPWSEKNPNKAEAFHRAWRISHDAVASARYDAFIKSISGQTYKATQAHVARGSRGVVFVTSRKNIPSIIMAALLLRKTGCKLPIVYMYNRGDTTEIEIEILRKYNVSTADYRDEIRGHTWSPEDWAKGASVASAILTAPFEEMIFLEPESYLLSDPTSLLDSNEFQAHGALFWAGPGKRRRDDHLRDVLKVPKGVNEGESDEVEFKAGIMVVSKAKAWKALKYVEHILFNADYFFKHLDGYRDAFYYGFLAAQQTYFLNPTAPTLIGVMTQHNATTPETFCGQAILQYNLASSASGGAPKPLVLDMRFAKSKYDPVVDHLMVASIVDGGKRGVDTKNVGTIGKYSDCLIWDAASSGVAALISDWQSLYPKVNTVLHEVRSQLPGEHEVQKLKRQKLLGALSGSSPFQPTPTPARSRWSIWPPSKKKKKEPTKKKVSPLGLTNVPEAVEVEHERGLVMPASATNLANVVRTMLLLRESGWKLPITITYYGSDLGEMQIVGLKTFRVDVVELTPRIQPDSEWTSHELNMAVRIESIIAAPYAQVLMLDLDTDIYPLQDPTYLFNAKPFRDTGALFWPDVRARNQSSALWAAFEMTKKWEGMVLDAGHFLVDKRKVWNALMMARHLVSEGKFYTSHFESDADPLFWGLLETNTPFHLTSTHMTPLGIVVDEAHPYGGASIPAALTELAKTPHGRYRSVRYCGLATVHHDDFSLSPNSPTTPLFVRLRFHPDAYEEDFTFLQIAEAYDVPPAVKAPLHALLSSRTGPGFVVERDVPFHSFCVALTGGDGVGVAMRDVAGAYAKVVERYWGVQRRVVKNTRKI